MLLLQRILPWLLYSLPLIWIATQVTATANPVEYLYHQTGDWAAYGLVLTLWITPLRQWFGDLRGLQWLKRLPKYRRGLGIAVFFYAFLHFTVHILDNLDAEILLKDLQRTYLLTGFIAFLLLLLLALTSNNAAMRRLGGKRWKKLHRVAYVAALFVAVHLFLNEKSDSLQALFLFVPLLCAELIRLFLWLRSQKWRAAH
jgi:sulfoxide reductase heme-binding subunit YedZ